jgi:hypothetical protein
MKGLQADNGKEMQVHKTQKKEVLKVDIAPLVAEECQLISIDRPLVMVAEVLIRVKHAKTQIQRRIFPQMIRKCVHLIR